MLANAVAVEVASEFIVGHSLIHERQIVTNAAA
jgi:hypothetical protein